MPIPLPTHTNILTCRNNRPSKRWNYAITYHLSLEAFPELSQLYSLNPLSAYTILIRIRASYVDDIWKAHVTKHSADVPSLGLR